MKVPDTYDLEAQIVRLIEERDECKATIQYLREVMADLRQDVAAWKANHDNQVAIKRAVLDRPDLGERAKSVVALSFNLSEAVQLLKCAKHGMATAPCSDESWDSQAIVVINAIDTFLQKVGLK